MDKDKLHQLLRNIRDLKYPSSSLRNVGSFEDDLAADLTTGVQEAMALLGYLLTRGYVRIIPDMGLVLNPDNAELQGLMKKGFLDSK
jgi:hypothetical protein